MATINGAERASPEARVLPFRAGRGVEPDPIAARIAALRVPGIRIEPRSLQDVVLGHGSYDLAIGNMPFGHPASKTGP